MRCIFVLLGLCGRLCLCGLIIGSAALCGRADDPGSQNPDRPADAPSEAADRQGGEAPIDFDKARTLIQKQRRGETLTPEEQRELDRARAARQSRMREPSSRPDRPDAPMSGRPSMTFPPLTDLPANERYRGQSGGLYGEGRNEPPAEHRQDAMKAAAAIRPLDQQGQPDANGKVVLISLGMSNTTQEFSAFQAKANRDPEKSPQVVIVDGAQGGQDASRWVPRGQNGNPMDPWQVLDQRLRRAGVTAEQVQVVWIKQALASPRQYGEFPGHARKLQEHLQTIVRELKQRFPNLQIAYLSSRTYAGYATTPLNPEPYAYESAFAVRWLIEDQIEGDPDLRYDPAAGDGKAPLLLWGPYLWADGEQGRKSDDLVWRQEDFRSQDGTHPSDGGREKVADLLLQFFKTDPTAKSWFLHQK